MSDRAEVTVIGGGAVGSATAYYLAEKGLDVALVERGGLASGTSGSCQGAIIAQLFGPPLLTYVLESQKLYRELRDHGLDYEYDQTGTFLCFDRDEQRPMVEKHAKMLRTQGLAISLYERDELKALDPAIGDNVVGASVCFEDFITNPIKVAHSLAFAAKRLGATLHLFSDVRQIEMAAGEINAVITSQGIIKTDCVVVAAGVWSPTITQMIDYTLPVYPQRGQLLVTEPVKQFKIRYVLDVDYLTTAYNPEAVKASKDPRIKLGVAASLAQTKTGNWLIGSSRDLVGFDRSCTPETIKWLVKRAMTFIPELGRLNCIRSFAGLRPITDDGMPVLGRITDVNNFILATGLHGEGIMLAPLWGKLTTELVMGKKPSMPIELFSPVRFQKIQ